MPHLPFRPPHLPSSQKQLPSPWRPALGDRQFKVGATHARSNLHLDFLPPMQASSESITTFSRKIQGCLTWAISETLGRVTLHKEPWAMVQRVENLEFGGCISPAKMPVVTLLTRSLKGLLERGEREGKKMYAILVISHWFAAL